MNLYVLTEGITEKEVYRAWFRHILKDHEEISNYQDATGNSFYVFQAGGNKQLLGRIQAAVEEINAYGAYDWLVVVLDSDGDEKKGQAYADVIDEIKTCLAGSSIQACVSVIVQNVCIETWFLGNLEMYLDPNPKEANLKRYFDHYRPDRHDPERMPALANESGTLSRFHALYFTKLADNFCHHNSGLPRYAKKRPDLVCTPSFLNALQARLLATPGHLASFGAFMSFVSQVQTRG